MPALRSAARYAAAILVMLLAGVAFPRAASAEVHELRIGVQPGLTYLPFVLMRHDHMIEQRAEAAGLGTVAVTWWSVAGGNVMNDAMLAGSLDIANSGTPAFFPLWSKTVGSLDVKGLSAYNALPLKLNTSNPKVRTIADFTENDRIALPAVKASSQAILLQMESEHVFGPGQHGRLDAITVSRAHPDSMIALLSGRSEITAHFGAPPYQDEELRHPQIHTVLTGTAVTGGPTTIGMAYAMRKFHDANPKLVGVYLAALGAAIERIRADHAAVAAIYLEETKEKDTVENILAILSDPEFQFGLAPQKMVMIAHFMHRIGSIKNDPESWQTLFFPEIHALPGS
jgi:NitT/TauT family transport system substrate-binding protein